MSDDPTINRKLLNRTGAGVAISVMLMQGVALFALIKMAVPEGNTNAFMFVLGALTNQVTSVVSYFFGSSVRTSQQGDVIAAQASTAAKLADTAAIAAGANGHPTHGDPP